MEWTHSELVGEGINTLNFPESYTGALYFSSRIISLSRRGQGPRLRSHFSGSQVASININLNQYYDWMTAFTRAFLMSPIKWVF